MFDRWYSPILRRRLARPYPKRARRGYVICRCPRPLELHEKVTALPWSHL